MDCRVHGIIQARILKWVAFPFSRGSSQPRDWTQVSHIAILYQVSLRGSPRILEWVAYPFSSGSSQSRNWTGISCIAGGFFTNWAMREAKKSESCSVMSNSLQSHELYSPWNSPGQNTGVGSLSLPQGNPPNPGIKPRSPTLQADSLPA